jgi:hypothetical protein
MTDDIKLWLPPMLTLLGTLIIVTFTARLNTLSVHAIIAELRMAVRADIAELRGELKLDILRIENKVDHYAETRASHSEEIGRLKAAGKAPRHPRLNQPEARARRYHSGNPFGTSYEKTCAPSAFCSSMFRGR